MKSIKIIELINKLIAEEIEKGLSTQFDPQSDSSKKMREFVLSKINKNIIAVADWVVAKDFDSLNNFFTKISEMSANKFKDYTNPENFTDEETKLIVALGRKSKKNVNMAKLSISFEFAPGKTALIYKKLYSDGKRLAYFASIIDDSEKLGMRDKSVAKSEAFNAAKGQSLKELLRMWKKVMDLTGEEK